MLPPKESSNIGGCSFELISADWLELPDPPHGFGRASAFSIPACWLLDARTLKLKTNGN